MARTGDDFLFQETGTFPSIRDLARFQYRVNIELVDFPSSPPVNGFMAVTA